MSHKASTPLTVLLTPEDLSTMLQMPERTLDDWRYRGLGPNFIRVGKRIRYRPAAVEAWLKTLER